MSQSICNDTSLPSEASADLRIERSGLVCEGLNYGEDSEFISRPVSPCNLRTSRLLRVLSHRSRVTYWKANKSRGTHEFSLLHFKSPSHPKLMHTGLSRNISPPATKLNRHRQTNQINSYLQKSLRWNQVECVMPRDNTYARIFDRLYPHLFSQSHAWGIYPKIIDSGVLDQATNLLSIGAGNGLAECRLAKHYGVQLSYIDPSQLHRDAFHRNARKSGVEASIVDSYLGKFQDYQTEQRFDLVLSLHSWYAFGYEEKMLSKVFQLLKPGGHLFIYMNSKDDPLRQALSYEPKVNAEGFAKWAKRLGHAFEFHYLVSKIPAAPLFDGDQLSIDAQDFIHFIARSPWPNLPSEDRDRVTRLFRDAHEKGYFQRKTAYMLFRHDE